MSADIAFLDTNTKRIPVSAAQPLPVTSGAGTAGAPAGAVQSVQSPAPLSSNVTIANGASLSGAADLANAVLVGIIIPSAWTAAAITFAGSVDNVTFYPLIDATLGEYTVPSANVATAAATMIRIPYGDLMSVRYLKVRSGTSGTPVTQGADRVLTLVYRA